MPTPEQVAQLERQDPRLLGDRIRDNRRAKGLGQADVAKAVGVSISFISRIEAGKRRADLSLIAAIAASLGVTVDALLGVEPPIPERQASTRPPELEFAVVALEMGEAAAALTQLDELKGNFGSADRAVSEARGRALEMLGRLSEAIAELEEIELTGSDILGDAVVATTLSRLYRESGEMLRAIRVGEVALTAISDCGLTGSDEAVQLAVTVAAAYFEQGDREYAVRLCQRILAAAEEQGSAAGRAAAYWNSAAMDFEQGLVESAVPKARRALALLSEGRDQRNLGRLEGQLGLMELHLSPPDLEFAEQHLMRARDLFSESAASHVDRQRMELALARLDLLRGDASAALDRAGAVPSTVHEEAPPLEAEALATAGEAALALNERDNAHQLFLQAVTVLAGVGAIRGVAQLWLDLGTQLQALGDADAGADAFQRAAVAAGLRPAFRTPTHVPAAADS